MTTTDGEVIRARHFVASGLNPQQTFLELMAEEDVPADWRNEAGAFAYDRLAPLFALNLCLDEAPHYAAADLDPALELKSGAASPRTSRAL